jgi:hypothetical protein
VNLGLLRVFQYFVRFVVVQLPQHGQQLKHSIVVLGGEAQASRSGIESDAASLPVFRRIEHLVNRIQGERRRNVLPKAHDHAGEIIATNGH